MCNGGRGKPATFASMENMNPGTFVLFKIVGKGAKKHVNTLAMLLSEKLPEKSYFFFLNPAYYMAHLRHPVM